MFKTKKIIGLISLLFFIFIFTLTYQNNTIIFNNINNSNTNNKNIINLSNQSSHIFNNNLKETLAIIDKVNNSAYIIFYPNLSNSYKYLQEAKNESSKNLSYALILLNKSRENALLQESILNKMKVITFIIVLILTVITSIVLYFIIIPGKILAINKISKKPKNK
jgi:hypothetical protein